MNKFVFLFFCFFVLVSCKLRTKQSKIKMIDLRKNTEPLAIIMGRDNNACQMKSYTNESLQLTENHDFLKFKDIFEKYWDKKGYSNISAYLNDSSYKKYSETEESADLYFLLNRQKICNYQARFHKIKKKTFLTGDTPLYINSKYEEQIIKTPLKKDLEKIIQQLPYAVGEFKLYRTENCLYIKNQKNAQQRLELYALVNYDFRENIPIKIVVDHRKKVISHEFLFLKASAHLNIYKKGSKRNPVEVKMNDFQNSGYLCSDRVATKTDTSQLVSYSKNFDYRYAIEDPRIEQNTAFFNAHEFLIWIEKYFDKNWAKSQLLLYFNNSKSSVEGGPYYINPELDNIEYPTIVLPSYMKNNLRYLRLDPDPLIHEIMHHIIYQYVGMSSHPEHVALHEGLADFFLFSYTKDPCLGEIICIKNSSVCNTGNKCLRTAQNKFKIGDKDYEKLSTHKKSQVISGLLWDLSKKRVLIYIKQLNF